MLKRLPDSRVCFFRFGFSSFFSDVGKVDAKKQISCRPGMQPVLAHSSTLLTTLCRMKGRSKQWAKDRRQESREKKKEEKEIHKKKEEEAEKAKEKYQE